MTRLLRSVIPSWSGTGVNLIRQMVFKNLIRWSELDLSRAFQLFYRQIKYKMDNYALIINNQEFIFSKIEFSSKIN